MALRPKRRGARKQLPLLPSEWPEADTDVAVERERLKAEDLFGLQLRAHYPNAAKQWRFAQPVGRQWRFDWALVDVKLAIEIEGLVMRRLAGQLVVMGRHATPAGIYEDMAKYNTAILLGWRVLRFGQNDIAPRRAIDMTLRVLAALAAASAT